MPTGYTADVQSGKMTEFRDFALLCARAFGATILMRDEPLDAKIPDEFTVDTRYSDRVRDCREKLAELEAMTIEEAAAAARAENEQQHARRDELVRNSGKQLERYQSMLAKVKAWTPPSEEHVGMKKFMVDQLTESIKFDCHVDHDDARSFAERCYPPSPVDSAEWIQKKLDDARRDLGRALQSEAEEIERVASRNKWVRQLRESLA